MRKPVTRFPVVHGAHPVVNHHGSRASRSSQPRNYPFCDQPLTDEQHARIRALNPVDLNDLVITDSLF